MEDIEKNKPNWYFMTVILTLMNILILVNCSGVQGSRPVEIANAPESAAIEVTKTPQPVPTLTAGLIATPTITESVTFTPVPTLGFDYFGSGVSYDEEQKKVINALSSEDPGANPWMRVWEVAIKEYWMYWEVSRTVSREWLRDGRLPVVWSWDENDPHNPDKVMAYIDINAFGADCFSVPVINGHPQFLPPEKYMNGQNMPGQEPLLLTKTGALPDGRQFFLGVENGAWVRYDRPAGRGGKAIQILNDAGRFATAYEGMLYEQTTVEFVLESGEVLPLPGFIAPELALAEAPDVIEELERKLFEIAVQFIADDNVAWGKMGTRGNELSEADFEYYNKLFKIPNIRKLNDPAATLFGYHISPQNSFELGFFSVTYGEVEGALLSYIQPASTDASTYRIKAIFIGVPIADVLYLLGQSEGPETFADFHERLERAHKIKVPLRPTPAP